MTPIQAGKTGQKRIREAETAGDPRFTESTSRQRVNPPGPTATFNPSHPVLRPDGQPTNVGAVTFALARPPVLTSSPAPTVEQPQQSIPLAKPLIYRKLTFGNREPLKDVKAYSLSSEGVLEETVFKTLREAKDERGEWFMVNLDHGKPVIAFNRNGKPHSYKTARDRELILDEETGERKTRISISSYRKYREQKTKSENPTGELTLSKKARLRYNVKAWFRSPEGELKQTVFETLCFASDRTGETFVVSVHKENGKWVIKYDDKKKPVIALNKNGKPHSYKNVYDNELILDERTGKPKTRSAIELYERCREQKPESANPTGKLTLSKARPLYNVRAWFRSPEGELKQTEFEMLGSAEDQTGKVFVVMVHEEDGQPVIKYDGGRPVVALTSTGKPHNPNSAAESQLFLLSDGQRVTQRCVRKQKARGEAPVPALNQSGSGRVATDTFVFRAGEEPQQNLIEPGPSPAQGQQLPIGSAGGDEPFGDDFDLFTDSEDSSGLPSTSDDEELLPLPNTGDDGTNPLPIDNTGDGDWFDHDFGFDFSSLNDGGNDSGNEEPLPPPNTGYDEKNPLPAAAEPAPPPARKQQPPTGSAGADDRFNNPDLNLFVEEHELLYQLLNNSGDDETNPPPA